MLLFIDTSDFESSTLALVANSVQVHKFSGKNLSESLLVEIKKFLNKNKIGLQQISKIAVVTGPGGFSRIRTAIATANALGFSLKIPIGGLKKDKVPTDLKKLSSIKTQKMVEPFYDKQPNITLPKKR